jgi:hypothetical protein
MVGKRFPENVFSIPKNPHCGDGLDVGGKSTTASRASAME